jgi:hypothetical protein
MSGQTAWLFISKLRVYSSLSDAVRVSISTFYYSQAAETLIPQEGSLSELTTFCDLGFRGGIRGWCLPKEHTGAVLSTTILLRFAVQRSR